MDTSDFQNNPLEQFEHWFLQAQGKMTSGNLGLSERLEKKLSPLIRRVFTAVFPSMDRFEYNAVFLATASKDGVPSSRVVLLKGYDEKGFRFYTNYTSRKAKELDENPKASLCFYWGLPPRQVRIEGDVEKLSYDESNKYWLSRPRGSRLSALASDQSSPISTREELDQKVKELEQKYEGQEIPCPENWGGYILKPHTYEFWQGMPSRNHIRLQYKKTQDSWQKSWLQP